MAGFLKTGEKGICQIKVKLEVFRFKEQYAYKNMTLCLDWEDLCYATKESKL